MVAVSSVRVMEVPVDEVVDVIAMRNRGVAARRAVYVIGRVALARMSRRARSRIRRIDGDRAFVDVVAVHRVKVTVVEVVDVASMLARDVAATGAVNVLVLGMRAMGAHRESFRSRWRARTVPCRSAAGISSNRSDARPPALTDAGGSSRSRPRRAALVRSRSSGSPFAPRAEREESLRHHHVTSAATPGWTSHGTITAY
jgi:hypothetical protein